MGHLGDNEISEWYRTTVSFSIYFLATQEMGIGI